MAWPEAGNDPNFNVLGANPRLRDPEHGDFRPAMDSPAVGYGCRTFGDPDPVRPDPVSSATQDAWIIGRDTVWDQDTIRVAAEVVVPDGTTLTIAPGVTVLFEGYFAISVQGRVLAVGEPGEPIRFDSADPEAWAPDSTIGGSWAGLRFEDTPARNGLSRLEWCEIRHAKGVEARRGGGALSLIGCSVLRARNCRFEGNLAEYGAVVYCERMANPVLSGCLMANNYALKGGSAVYAIDSYPKLNANTIAGNECLNPEPADDTGAIHNHHAKTTVRGSIVFGNLSHYYFPLQMREAKSFYVSYCDVEGGFQGIGNFDADPLFSGIPEHPMSLAAGSPCMDSGPPDTTGLGLGALDLATLPRVRNGRIDVGGYEEWDVTGVSDDEAPHAAGPGSEGTGPATGGSESGESGSVLGWIESCRPNPLGAVGCRLFLRLSREARVQLSVFHATGRRVAMLVDERMGPGELAVQWNGRDLGGAAVPSGVYFGVLDVDGRETSAYRVIVAR